MSGKTEVSEVWYNVKGSSLHGVTPDSIKYVRLRSRRFVFSKGSP